MASVFITGATGFVGSNVAEVLSMAGHHVIAGVRAEPSRPLPFDHAIVDYTSVDNIAQAAANADAIVHLAIANDFNRLQLNRPEGYDAYVGLTQRVVHAAATVGAQPIYMSSDWVLDGRRHLEDEDQPPNPLNFYGVLKALGEQVMRDLAPHGAITRVGGVMGQHRLADNPRSQDVGFGYFVVSLVNTVRAGKQFGVFEGEGVNYVATPALASEIGAGIERIISRKTAGMFHLVASNPITRFDLADLVCEVFELDSTLISRVPVPEEARFSEAVPYDTSMSSVRTREILGLAPSTVRDQLEAFKRELETGKLHPLTTPEK